MTRETDLLFDINAPFIHRIFVSFILLVSTSTQNENCKKIKTFLAIGGSGGVRMRNCNAFNRKSISLMFLFLELKFGIRQIYTLIIPKSSHVFTQKKQ